MLVTGSPAPWSQQPDQGSVTEAKAVLYRLSLEWLSSLLGSGNVRPEESRQLGRERQQKARKAPGRLNVLHPEVSADSGPRAGCIRASLLSTGLDFAHLSLSFCPRPLLEPCSVPWASLCSQPPHRDQNSPPSPSNLKGMRPRWTC